MAEVGFVEGGSTTLLGSSPAQRKRGRHCRFPRSLFSGTTFAAVPGGETSSALASPCLRHRPAAAGPKTGLPAFSLLLVTALTAAVIQQGAYYREAQVLVGVILTLSFLLAVRTRPWTKEDMRCPPLWLFALLAAWAIMSGARAGDPLAAGGIVALLAGVVMVVAVCRRTDERDGLAAAAVAVGALTAVIGWVGVAWRIAPLALEDQGLWRAASTVTYANASAGLLAPLAVLALGRSAARPRDPVASISSCLLLVGLGATLSRAGALSLVIGVVALAVLVRPGRAVRALVAPVSGSAIALAGLLPSVPADSAARPLLAGVALSVGLAAAAVLALVRIRALVLLCAVFVGIGGVMVATGAAGALSTVSGTRLVISSPDRGHELRAALDVARAHPVAGAGPGRATLTWTGHDGTVLVARYAHNEYVQVLAELGAVGLVLVLAILAAITRAVRRARAVTPWPDLSGGAAAGLVAMAVGSAFDFLWHVPAVPLIGALLIGITTVSPSAVERARSNNRNQ